MYKPLCNAGEMETNRKIMLGSASEIIINNIPVNKKSMYKKKSVAHQRVHVKGVSEGPLQGQKTSSQEGSSS